MEDLFDQHWDPQDPTASLQRLQALRLRVKASGDPFLYCQLLGRLAGCLSLLDQFERAQEALNDMDFVLMDAAQRLPQADPRAAGRARALNLLERGRMFRRAGWDASARDALEGARELARHWEDERVEREAESLLGGG